MMETEINFDEYMPTSDAADHIGVSEGRLRQIAREKGEEPKKRYGVNWWRRVWVEQLRQEREAEKREGK